MYDTGPTAIVAPVVPFLCALVFKFGGVLTDQSLFWLLLFQSACAASACVWIFLIAEHSVGRGVGFAAAAIWAVFPWFAKWPVTWLWDTSLTAAYLAFLIAFAMWMETRMRPWMWPAFGGLWGFGLLINPALATTFPVVLLWLAWSARTKGKAWVRPALLSAAMCVLALTPWMVRNYVAFGQVIFLRSNFWLEFSTANYPGSFGRGFGGRHPEANLRELAHYGEMGEVAYIRLKGEEARAYIREHPREFLELSAKRVVWFWDGSNMLYRPRIASYWLPASYAWFSYLGLLALVYACARRVHGWPLFLGAVFVYPLPYYVTYGAARFRHALEPLLLVLIVHFVADAWRTLRRPWQHL